MKMNQLGRTGIEVSQFGLGTMTWGRQTSARDAHNQIDRALDAGINFIDTAEMYPVNPVKAESVGRSERIIGLWLDLGMRRNDVVLATKIAGEGLEQIRNGAPISPKTIATAVEGSLRRLKTEHIDLYQLHWPNRGSYMFRQNWTFDPTTQLAQDTRQHMADTLGALQEQVKRGTIRAFGISNESAWGLTQWVATAERDGGPRVASIQNEYSLLCRLFDTDLAEASVQEDVPLLAFSPLAAGLLTGKYQGGKVPDASRMSINGSLGGRKTKLAFKAVDAYLHIAKKHGLDPIQMALAWCATRPFMASVLIGATNEEQLENALGARDVNLSKDVLKEIAIAHKANPIPY